MEAQPVGPRKRGKRGGRKNRPSRLKYQRTHAGLFGLTTYAEEVIEDENAAAFDDTLPPQRMLPAPVTVVDFSAPTSVASGDVSASLANSTLDERRGGRRDRQVGGASSSSGAPMQADVEEVVDMPPKIRVIISCVLTHLSG